MKITQTLIDQAAMIANAKVGDELEESVNEGASWHDGGEYRSVILHSSKYSYRIKPQPRVVYCNLYGGMAFAHSTPDRARKFAEDADAIAVPFQQIGEGEKP